MAAVSRLPPEILREIVHLYLDDAAPLKASRGESYKPRWCLVQPLTVASKTIRLLSLEAWFRVLRLQSAKPLEPLDTLLSALPGVEKWVKQIHIVERYPKALSAREYTQCARFPLARKLVFDRIALWHHRLGFEMPAMPFACELDYYSRNGVGPPELMKMVEDMPGLRILSLHHAETWCGLCNLNVHLRTSDMELPQSIEYKDGFGLPTHFGRWLAPLRDLHTVHFEVMRESDFFSRINTRHRTPRLWSGECSSCVDSLLSDEKFSEEWARRKEVEYVRPPALKLVRWTVCEREVRDDETDVCEFGTDEGESDVGEETAG